MITTENLGLVVWDSEEDDFEHSQLADNFVRIDAHTHEGGLSEPVEPPGPRGETGGHWTALGLGLGIGTAAIKPLSIWRYHLAQRIVGHLQIDKEGVQSENIKKKNVLNEHVDDEAIDDRTILKETITIDKLDPNILKLGSTILWYKATPEEEPGDIWEVCDGRNWSEIPNAWGLTTGKIPDTRERFLRGTDLSHIGETGGSASVNLAHFHNIAAAVLNHVHIVGAHNHAIGPDGLHSHTFGGGNLIHTRQNAFTNEFTLRAEIEGKPGHTLPNWYESLYVAASEFTHDGGKVEPPFDEAVGMDNAGAHSHGGATGLSAAFGTSGSSLGGSVQTDTQLTNISTTPPYVGFVYIMRVR